MKVILENDAGEQTELPIDTDITVDGIRITVSKNRVPEFYDPVNTNPGGSGGSSGE